MANNYRAIVTEIKTKLERVAGIGLVHAYERQAVELAKFIALFKHGNKINGWEITRRAAPEHQPGAFFRHHQFVLRGYHGLQDANGSSIDFQEQCDEICAVFRLADPEAVGATWYYKNGDNPNASPAQLDNITDRMFGGVLCHCAEISLSITERIPG